MRQTFHHTLLNGPFGDPCLQVRIAHEARSLLFDLGDIHSVLPAALNRITDVFVTHTHIDHFLGFDVLLRASLRRTTPLVLYGPTGITGNVKGKLSGYAWNLIEKYPLQITVHEFSGRYVTQTVFAAKAKFRKKVISRVPSDGLLLKEPMFTVRAAMLDHGTPCLAFALEETLQVNIDKARLLQKGLSVGPWLTPFKKMIREGKTNRSIRIGRKKFAVGDLTDIVRTAKGQKICYATDIRICTGNRKRLTALAEHADTLYCEAYFLEHDKKLSLERNHLTARESGLIAKMAGVGKLVLVHSSPRYHSREQELIREAQEAFGGTVSLG